MKDPEALEANGRLWTTLDVARYLQASRSWVYSHAEDGTLPCVRVGGLLRFLPAEIEAYVKGIEIPPRNIITLPVTGRR